MNKLRAKLLAYTNADLQVFTKAKKSLLHLFHQDRVEFVDKNPDILVFLTGGSELHATQSVQENRFYLLLASPQENSWAAATEVKSWMNDKGFSTILVDQSEPQAQTLVDALYHAKNGLLRLQGKRFGLIGEPSDWLINSVIDPATIKEKLGVEQVDIPWADLRVLEHEYVVPDFLSFFKTENKLDIEKAGMVYETIAETVALKQLNAVTVECFSLVNSSSTTACLALSKLSMDGIPAGCEGDICSMVGMMVGKEVCGVVPWMANVAHVSSEKVLLAHCTIPGNLASKFSLDTHFETAKGVAINARVRGDEFTVFRFDNKLSRMFLSIGKVVSQPYSKNACRTQLLLEFNSKDAEYFTQNPLGNHHLIIPGNHTEILRITAELIGIKIVP